jgi:hypothetical protein
VGELTPLQAQIAICAKYGVEPVLANGVEKVGAAVDLKSDRK